METTKPTVQSTTSHSQCKLHSSSHTIPITQKLVLPSKSLKLLSSLSNNTHSNILNSTSCSKNSTVTMISSFPILSINSIM